MAKETAEALCQKAQEAISEGDNETAQLLYKQAIGLRPDYADAHYGLATVSFLRGEYPLAAYHFREVTRLDEKRAGAYINLGAVYNRLEQFDDAIPALRKGISLDKNRAEGYYNLGLVYRRKGQVDLAIQAYREATRINPRMADAHHNVANIYMEKGQFGLAIAHYRQALEIRPNWEKAQRSLEQAEATQEQAQSGGAVATKPASDPNAAAVAGKPSTKPAVPAAPDPSRTIDPMVHGEQLRSLHRSTIDAEAQGRKYLDVLEKEIEPAIKELSAALLYPDTSAGELDKCLRKFEAAIHNMRTMEDAMQTSTDRVRIIGEHLTKS